MQVGIEEICGVEVLLLRWVVAVVVVHEDRSIGHIHEEIVNRPCNLLLRRLLIDIHQAIIK